MSSGTRQKLTSRVSETKWGQKIRDTFAVQSCSNYKGANNRQKDSVEKTVRTIRRQTRKKQSAEDKIRIVLEGLRGETTIAELAGEKTSTTTCTIAGARSFPKQVDTAWLATQSGKPIAKK